MCNECKFNRCGYCSLLNCYTSEVSNCGISKEEAKLDIAEMFMKETNPIMYLTYLNWKRKDKYPAIGSSVVALVSGYGGLGGQILLVTGINDSTIELNSKQHGKFLAKKYKWWNDLYILREGTSNE